MSESSFTSFGNRNCSIAQQLHHQFVRFLEKWRSRALGVSGHFDRHDFFIETHAPLDDPGETLLSRVALDLNGLDIFDPRHHRRVHFAVDALHVVEEPEDRAPTDAGALGHRFRAWLRGALAREFQHRIDDATARFIRALPSPIDGGALHRRRFGQVGLRHGSNPLLVPLEKLAL